jgi:Putative transposase
VAASSEARSQDAPTPTFLDACAAIAMARGTVRGVRDDADAEQESAARVEAPPADERAVEHDGFNLQASAAVAAGDDLGRARLMRYGARPPPALDRLKRLPGGRMGYRVKKLRDGRAKHRVMTPLEFLARRSAMTWALSASGKTLVQSLKARLVVMQVDRRKS